MPKPTPKRVFILGAGFSKPAGFPLATELTDEVLATLRHRMPEDSDLFRFIDLIQDVHRWVLRSAQGSAINIEEFYEYSAAWIEHLRLEQHRESIGRDAGETPYQASRDIEAWLSYIDERLLNVLIEHECSARLTAIESFTAALRPTDAIITFNYDRLIERCLSSQSMSWSFGLENPTPGVIPVLKMHGSVDWICFARSQRCDRPHIRPLFSKHDENHERDGQQQDRTGEDEYDYELFQIQDDRALADWIKHRAIIQCDWRWGLAGLGPQKRPSLIPGLGVVWEHARHVLYHADHVIVVGFSFSPFDRLAQLLFGWAAASRSNAGIDLPRVTLIDPALIQKSNSVSIAGSALIQRVESVFRPVTPIGAYHEEFDWATLA